MALGLGEAGPGAVNVPGSFDAGKQGIELMLVRRQRRRRGAWDSGERQDGAVPTKAKQRRARTGDAIKDRG